MNLSDRYLREIQPQHWFTAGLVLSQFRLNRPRRALLTLIRLAQLLWAWKDCPLQRIMVFALVAAIPIGCRYGRVEDGFFAFLLFGVLAFIGWSRWRVDI